MLGGCADGLDLVQDEMAETLFVRPHLHWFLLWWLILFIEALVLSPNIEREGNNNDQFERGQLVQVILTKAIFPCQRLWW